MSMFHNTCTVEGTQYAILEKWQIISYSVEVVVEHTKAQMTKFPHSVHYHCA